MLRAQYESRGPVPQDVIHAVELRTPSPAAGEALIEVVAAPVNPSDLLTLTGEYGHLPSLPAIGGREGVGRVAELGAETEGPAVGQLVLPSAAAPGRRTSSIRHAPERRRTALFAEIARLVAAGTLHAPVHARYDVSEIEDAVAAAASGGRSLKILIVPRRGAHERWCGRAQASASGPSVVASRRRDGYVVPPMLVRVSGATLS